MLKTTVLIAGLAASSALDKKECNPASAPSGETTRGTKFECKDAKASDAFCAITDLATPTHVGGGIRCREHNPYSTTNGGCFEYQHLKACKIPTEAEWKAMGCTGTAPAGLAENTAALFDAGYSARYTCTFDAKTQAYTTSNGVKTYNADTTGYVYCKDGAWVKNNFDDGGNCKSAPAASSDASYELATAYSSTGNPKVEDPTCNGGAGCDDDFQFFSDQSTGYTNCAGTWATDFPSGAKSGTKCYTKVKRRTGANFGHEGEVKCVNGAWEYPKRMCGLPKELQASSIYAAKFYTAAAPSSTATTAAAVTIGKCGNPTTTIIGASLSGTDLNVGNNAAASRAFVYMSQTTSTYKCYSDAVTQTNNYAGGEISCAASGVYTLNEAPRQCGTGTLDQTEVIISGVSDDFTLGSTFVPTFDTTAGLKKYLAPTAAGNDAKLTGAASTCSSTTPGATGTDPCTLVALQHRLECTCTTSGTDAGKWKCDVKKGCAAVATATTYNQISGRPVACATSAITEHDGVVQCTTAGKVGTLKCEDGTLKAVSARGKTCVANVTLPDTVEGKAKAQAATGYGFSWSVLEAVGPNTASATSKTTRTATFAVPTEGRTTCGIDRWYPGHLTCDHATGEFSIQGDYTKCAGAGGEITAEQKTGWNYDTLSIGQTPGSTATITCAAGAGGGASDDHLKGSGVCSSDNKGTVTWKPCLRPCTAVNSSQVMDSIKASGTGKNDTTGLEFSGTNCSSTNGMANVSSSSYLYACTNGIKTADHYYGGSVSCNAVTGKYEAEAATKRKCDLGALASGTLAKLCTDTAALRTNGTDFDSICKAHADGLKSTDEAVKTRWTEFGSSTYDCTVKGTMDKEACNVTIKGDNPPYKSVAATCDTSNAGQADTKNCISPAADRNTAGCYKITFEANTDGSAASVIGAGIVTLLALFHL